MNMNMVLVTCFNYYQIVEKNTIIFFKNKTQIEVIGESCEDVLEVINKTNNMKTVAELQKECNLDGIYFLQIVEFLINKSLVDLRDNSHLKKKNIWIDYINKDEVVNSAIIKNDKKTILCYCNSLKSSIIPEVLGDVFNLVLIDKVSNDLIKEKYDIIFSFSQYEEITINIKLQEVANEMDIPFLRIISTEKEQRIGPLFFKESFPCYNCLITRLYSNFCLANELFEKVSIVNNLVDTPIEIILVTLLKLKIQLVKYFFDTPNCLLLGEEYVIKEDFVGAYNTILQVNNCRLCQYQNLEV
ncbi:hypothetical protein [Carnobacterium maltaromaticum]|uniref:hypothetical protein n=1 Tax=Carnobacterium maltaromaticum TaxID=2751 RepID=UPI0039BEB7D4